jgi:hypothetical protein
VIKRRSESLNFSGKAAKHAVYQQRRSRRVRSAGAPPRTSAPGTPAVVSSLPFSLLVWMYAENFSSGIAATCCQGAALSLPISASSKVSR